VLERKDEMRDLGIIYDAKWNKNAHVTAICRKANQMRGFIQRNCVDFKDIRTIKVLYTSLVRSHVESATVIWNSLTITQERQVEKIQHKFIRYVAHKFFNHRGYEISYEEYEKKLKLQPLALRRLINDVKFTVDSFTDRIDSQTFLHFFRLYVPPRVTRNRTLEGLKVFHLDNYKSTIFNRLMANFNSSYNDHDVLNKNKIFQRSRVTENYNQ
jgi:hypothetical protein